MEFGAEAEVKRSFYDRLGHPHQIRPDALVRLNFGAFDYSWFIEVDRGTEGLAVIDAKCRAYREYELADVEYQRYGVIPTVLFVAPDQHRAENIARVISKQPAEAQRLFKVTTDADAVAVLLHPEI